MSNHLTVAYLKRFLHVSCHTDAETFFPSLLIALSRDELYEKGKQGITIDDLAIRYFLRLGLRCDRNRKNLYGYPGLFRFLNEPPPWVYVTLEDIEEQVSVERDAELRPLYIQANQTDPQLLVDEYRKHSDPCMRLENVVLRDWLADSLDRLEKAGQESEKWFRETLELARCLGVEQFEAVYNSIFGPLDEPFEDFTPMPGVPDLFVWSESDQLWFFAEVKGLGDYLRKPQVNWIRDHWETIKGRFALVLPHEA